MSHKPRKYTDEFKEEAIKLALRNSNVAETAKSLGMPMATLHGWVNSLKDLKNPKQNLIHLSKPIDGAALLEENRRLLKENAILKEEKEILKKAATYFAQHQK
jgi:transposase